MKTDEEKPEYKAQPGTIDPEVLSVTELESLAFRLIEQRDTAQSALNQVLEVLNRKRKASTK